MGAYHGSELQYLFKMTSLPGPKTPSQQTLSDQMIQYWSNFVKTGNPNGPGLPKWPRYEDGAGNPVMHLKANAAAAPDAHRARYEFLETFAAARKK